MIGRMMVSALALTGTAYAQTPPAGEERLTPDCAATSPCAASALPASSANRIIYDAAFFTQFNPQTALDIARQTPGFSLDGGDDRRGFSGAVGNVLIDGLRPTSKSQSIGGILSRIPANQVVRVEVLRGAEVAGDASGQSMLLNVVRTSSAGSGVWDVGIEYTSRDVPAPRGSISYSGRNGQFEYGLGASVFSIYRAVVGWRELSDANGDVTGTVDTPSPRDYREGALNGNIAFPLAGGRFSATGEVRADRFHADSDFFFFDAAGAPDFSLLTVYEERNRGFELGLNYDRDLGPWALAAVGLVNRNRYESEEDARFEDALGALVSTQTQEVRQDSGETILRGALSRPFGARHRVEFGAEAALNTLEQQLAFVSDPPTGPIPNSNVDIEEERAEVFAVHTWRPAERWSLETRLAWETSTLTFTGDTDDTVELSFWKPSVQLSRTVGANNQLRLRVYRDVGQLDFGDFVSAAAIADNLIAGGNPELVPQTDWRIELGADMRFRGGAALGLTLTHHQISDTADLVPIVFPNPNEDPGDPNDDFIRFDGPGNIGDGEAWSLDVNFTTPLSPLIPGGRITVEGSLWDTEVTDPTTGQTRIFSQRPESSLEIEFRQDFRQARFAWGVNYDRFFEAQSYRFNEIDTYEEGPWVDVFVETTALPNNMKLRAWAANAFDGTINRDRRFFAPDRNGAFVRRDLRERRFERAPWLIVQLSGTF